MRKFLRSRGILTAIRTPLPTSSGAVPAEYVIVPEEGFTVFVTIFLILLGIDEPGFGAYDYVRLGITSKVA